MSLGERIKAEREKKGLSQTELAREFGFTQSIICKYEHGTKKPTTEGLVELAKFFGVSTDYLLGLKEE